jgi:hypothetical protein
MYFSSFGFIEICACNNRFAFLRILVGFLSQRMCKNFAASPYIFANLNSFRQKLIETADGINYGYSFWKLRKETGKGNS